MSDIISHPWLNTFMGTGLNRTSMTSTRTRTHTQHKHAQPNCSTGKSVRPNVWSTSHMRAQSNKATKCTSPDGSSMYAEAIPSTKQHACTTELLHRLIMLANCLEHSTHASSVKQATAFNCNAIQLCVQADTIQAYFHTRGQALTWALGSNGQV